MHHVFNININHHRPNLYAINFNITVVCGRRDSFSHHSLRYQHHHIPSCDVWSSGFSHHSLRHQLHITAVCGLRDFFFPTIHCVININIYLTAVCGRRDSPTIHYAINNNITAVCGRRVFFPPFTAPSTYLLVVPAVIVQQ